MIRKFVPRAAAIALMAVLSASCSDTSFVDELSIANRTDYPAHVIVSDGDGAGWLGLAYAAADSNTTVEVVADQGAVWVFRFDYFDRYHEEVEISRSELMRADWVVEVPQSFEDGLRAAGVEPPP